MRKQLNKEKFHFTEEGKKQIKESYMKFVEESLVIAKECKISEDKRQIVISYFIEDMIKKILLKNETEQSIVFSEDEKEYFKENVLKIIGIT